jgi:putative hemolysin
MEYSSSWSNSQFTNFSFLEPSIAIDINTSTYQVKTINQLDELLQVLRLRFDVFFREFSSKKRLFSLFPFDIDKHDFACDHLIVKDKNQNKVVACYRLLTSHHKKSFYSEGEFDLNSLLILEGHKVELGRAAVHQDYRHGAVISLLWKGLLEYARKSEARYLFGCSSIGRKDFHLVPQMISYLERKNGFIEDLSLTVRPQYQMRFEIQDTQVVSKTRPLNSLMHMYLMAGAKMGRPMAYDKEMDCLDMLTFMDLSQLPTAFEKRFA